MKNLAKCSERSKGKKIVVEERGKKFTIKNDNEKEIVKVTVDNCLIDDERERCDYLFLIDGDCPEIVYVELKGKDVPKAASQLRTTMTYCAKLNQKRKRICYIVCRRSPLSGPEIQVLQAEFFKRHDAILRIKSIMAEHPTQ